MTTVTHRPVELAGILADPVEQFAKDKRLLTDALDRLPGTADGIASYFVERGIKGLPRTPAHCPVAQYVQQELEIDDLWVCAGPGGVITRRPFQSMVVADLPRSAFKFMHAFDSGRYPNLSREARA